jgi:hypothetical protein
LEPAHTVAGKEKAAVGNAFTVATCVVTGEEQPPEATISVMFLFPGVDQETVCGPAVLAVDGVAPAPKFQIYVAPAGAVPV